MLNDMDFFKGELMTLDLLEKLESKIQNAVDTIALLQMEVDELKGDNQGLLQKNDQLRQENIKLNEEHQLWQSRLSALVGKIEKAEDTM